MDDFEICRLIMLLPRRGGAHFIDLMPASLSAQRTGRPRPTQCINLLELLNRAGFDAGLHCDAVANSRAGMSVAPLTATIYHSHLRQIHSACRALGECGIDTIRRVSSVVGHPATLTGWLAAWRRIQCIARVPWAGDHDSQLLAICVGSRLSLDPGLVRQRCHTSLLREWEARVGSGRVCSAMPHVRITCPSELVGQAQQSLFAITARQIAHSPIKRKSQPHPQTLVRQCVCHFDRKLCPRDGLEFTFVRILHSIGHPEAASFTSDCFWRGSSIDILEAHGFCAMLAHGRWSSPRTAEPYVSADEQSADALGVSIAASSAEDQ